MCLISRLTSDLPGNPSKLFFTYFCLIFESIVSTLKNKQKIQKSPLELCFSKLSNTAAILMALHG